MKVSAPHYSYRQQLHELLAETITKHDELLNSNEWRAELIPRSVPVLWFGDATTEKKRILTMGANPSRSEFLKGRGGEVLEGEHARFFVRSSDREGNEELDLEAIINSYDRYFQTKPYRRWFGKQEGGKVEALLNGMDASLYTPHTSYAGLHIDLFPFATQQDFKQITQLAHRDLFESGWASNVLTNILHILSPSAVVITGRTNINHANDFLGDRIKWDTTAMLPTVGNKKCEVWRGTLYQHIPLVALSINLGNPVGWSRNDLLALGQDVAGMLELGN